MQKKLRKDRQGCTRIYSGVAWLGFRDGKVGLEREGIKRKNHCFKNSRCMGICPTNFLKKSLTKNAAQTSQQSTVVSASS